MNKAHAIEARRTLRARLKETLTDDVAPEHLERNDYLVLTHFLINKGGTVLGTLPVALQHLYVLAVQLKDENTLECHRRCVAFFGKENYDNESIEFRTHLEVDSDPRFNHAPQVLKILKRRVRRMYPELTTPEGHDVFFYIDNEFRVYKTEYRKKTLAEMKTSLRRASNVLGEYLNNR